MSDADGGDSHRRRWWSACCVTSRRERNCGGRRAQKYGSANFPIATDSDPFALWVRGFPAGLFVAGAHWTQGRRRSFLKDLVDGHERARADCEMPVAFLDISFANARGLSPKMSAGSGTRPPLVRLRETNDFPGNANLVPLPLDATCSTRACHRSCMGLPLAHVAQKELSRLRKQAHHDSCQVGTHLVWQARINSIPASNRKSTPRSELAQK